MRRCLDLASNVSSASPNPLVGSVVVNDGRVIGEGFHKGAGQPHAEVEAINSISESDKRLLPDSTLYVNLEPCSHHGKTPPCADLLIRNKISSVVIGTVDTNPLVGGKGISRLRDAGIDVTIGVLENECRKFNRRFFAYHQLKRPYVILKWAQSKDGFIAPQPLERMQLSNALSQTLVHKWRTEEDVVLVGFNTALVDDPQLNVRHWTGRNPQRAIYDPHLKLNANVKLFDKSVKTFVFNSIKDETVDNIVYKKVDVQNWVNDSLKALHDENILSVMVEGGTKTIQSFIDANCWNEARVITAPTLLRSGLVGPKLPATLSESMNIGDNQLNVYTRLG